MGLEDVIDMHDGSSLDDRKDQRRAHTCLIILGEAPGIMAECMSL